MDVNVLNEKLHLLYLALLYKCYEYCVSVFGFLLFLSFAESLTCQSSFGNSKCSTWKSKTNLCCFGYFTLVESMLKKVAVELFYDLGTIKDLDI